MEIKETVEKRHSRRAFFTLEDNVGLNLAIKPEYDIPDEFLSGENVRATLLSISTGGLGVTGTRYRFPPVKEGDRLILTAIQTPPPLGVIHRLDAEVRYVVTDDYSVRVVLGCEFLDISPAWRLRIDEYVAQRLKQNNINNI